MAHTQVATGGLMEKIEARALANKKAKANFHQPDVKYERLTPIMKHYLETVGEKIVVECARGMAEEAKRANILASMPKNAPGYKATERSFELERIREQKIIQKILHERDQKLAKATRFQRHIPPPTNPKAWTDNEDWVNAVMKQAKLLGIDPKREKEYELLPLAAESLEAPLPTGWKMKHGGARAVLKNGYDAHMSMNTMNTNDMNSPSRGDGSISRRNNHSKGSLDGGASDSDSQLSSKAPLVSYVNRSTGAVMYEHPLNSYYRSIASSRRTAAELVNSESSDQAAFDRCMEAEHAMRLVMDKMVNPENYCRVEEDEEENGDQLGNGLQRTLHFNDNVTTRAFDEVNNMTFTLPPSRLNGRVDNSRINTATTTKRDQTHTLSYRESVHIGTQETRTLPRVSLKEAGVTSRQNSQQVQNPPSLSPSSNSYISFEWSDDDAAKQAAFKNYGKSSIRPSTMATQREERRKQAEQTDPHTQRIAAPKGYSFDDPMYVSSRKVLPRQFPPMERCANQTRRGRSTANTSRRSVRQTASYSSRTRTASRSSSSYITTSPSNISSRTQQCRPGTTAVSQRRTETAGYDVRPSTLKKSHSLPSSPTDPVPYDSFRQDFQRGATPLASFMDDF